MHLAQAFLAVGAARCWHLMGVASRAWLLCQLAAVAAHTLWRHSGAHGAAYLRWRDATAALFRVSSLGFGAGAATMRAMLLEQLGAKDAAGEAAGAGGSALAHLAMLLFASSAVTMAFVSLAWQTRLRQVWRGVLGGACGRGVGGGAASRHWKGANWRIG